MDRDRVPEAGLPCPGPCRLRRRRSRKPRSCRGPTLPTNGIEAIAGSILLGRRPRQLAPVCLSLLKTRKRRASVSFLVPRPYRRGHDHTSVRGRFPALVPAAQPRLVGTRARCSATPGDCPASATPWPASALLHRPLALGVALPNLAEGPQHHGCPSSKIHPPWNRFADEDRDRRCSVIEQSASLLRRGLPAWALTAPAFERRNCGRRRRPAPRWRYGIEPICKVLPIAPSTYYAHVAKRADPTRLSARARRDDALMPEVRRVFEENFRVYGVRKV